MPRSADDTLPSSLHAGGSEPGAPEIIAGDTSRATRLEGDSEATQVTSPSARLAALVAQTRIRTGKHALPPPDAGHRDAEATERRRDPAPVGSASGPAAALEPSERLEVDSAPQTIGEGEPTEKSESPGDILEASGSSGAVNLEDDPALEAPSLVPPKGRSLLWKAGLVVVAAVLGWFAVTQVFPRSRILSGDATEADRPAAPPAAPIKEPPSLPPPPTAAPSPPHAATPTSPPTPAEPVAPDTAPTAERALPAEPTSGTEPVEAAAPRPTSHARSRSKAKASARPSHSVAEDPDAVLPPKNLSPPTAAPETPSRHKTKTTKRP